MKTVSDSEEHLQRLAKLLVRRLERLSADSAWAHRASGLRGALLRGLETLEEPLAETERAQLLEGLQQLTNISFRVLVQAAREIRPPRSSPDLPGPSVH